MHSPSLSPAHVPSNSAGPDLDKKGSTATRPVQLDSQDLLRGQKTVKIVHEGATYRLQATRLGKLILTK